MKIEWNKVTWYSKLVALGLFVALPFLGFYFGIRYSESTTLIEGGLVSSRKQAGNNISGTANSEFLNLQSKIENYLELKKETCSGEVGKCLDDLIAKLSEKDKTMSVSFSSPYPVSWQDGNAQFFLTGVSLGSIVSPPRLPKNPYILPGDLGYEEYKGGETIHALVMNLKITALVDTLVPVNIGRITDESGRITLPNTRRFELSGSGPEFADVGKANTTYGDQKIIFVVPEADKEFLFSTGGQFGTFFIVKLENGALSVEKIIKQG